MISVGSKGLFKEPFEYGESRGVIISEREDAIRAALSSIMFHRKQLERYIREHPRFLYSLKPIPVDSGPRVVKLMAEASKKAGVGPMAAVAGVLADLAVEAMVLRGAEVSVVEDGGEASIASDRPVEIALSAGDSPLSRRVGFRVEHSPVGVATSSGVFSHALSFGEAEAVTVFAENAGLADAVATAVGNLVRGEDHRGAVEGGIRRALSIDGVSGVFILYRGVGGIGGSVPPIIGVDPDGE